MRYHPLPGTALPVVVTATFVIVIWIGWGSWRYPVALWAPGALSRYHADIVSCMQCHEPFHGPSQTRCMTCHSGPYFEKRSTSATAKLHRDMVVQQTACSACHTEHRGALAQITDPARVNPHGEFIFLATRANSCSACHEFAARVAEPPRLKTNSLVDALRAAGGSAHVPGKMALCLTCHAKGT
ncbi:MAG TPA: hypothetical protein VJ805_08040 [Nitrospiraceae bacterium]|nr:hypothetical protein [Nitrospiraceae bacterium]